MNPSKPFSVSTAVLLAAGVIACQTAASAEPAALPRVEITAPATPGSVEAAEAVQAIASFQMAYAMSTGERMTVASRGQALRVRYGTRAPATLYHDGQGRFVSRDGQLAMRFGLDEFGEPGRVSLNMPADWQ